LHENDYFQQISPYWGTRRAGEPARIIELHVGLVGLVCRTGEPIVLKKNEKPKRTWEALWKKLHAGPDTHVRTPRANIASMLGFPIFTEQDGDRLVSLIIYADSAEPDFFVGGQPTDDDASPVLTRLFHAAAGFVANCNELQSKKVLRFATSSFWGMRPEPAKDSALIKEFETKNALFRVEQQIRNYNPQDITATIPLHWDCIYRNYEPLTDDTL
jgi:hypothetical protein